MELQKEPGIVLIPDSDHQLIARIRRVLNSSGYAALSQIRIVVERRHVYLEGRVPTYFLKQIAQTLVLSLEDVRFVSNNLVVEDRLNNHL